MREDQRLELRASEIRERLNTLTNKDEDLTEDEQEEVTKLTTEYRSVEAKRRAAIVTADEKAQEIAEQPDSEEMEIRAIRSRVERADYFEAALENRKVGGAAGEFNEARGLDRNAFPLEMLADDEEVEHRTTTDAETAVRPTSWVDRLFSDTAAAFLGLTMRDAEPGKLVVPQVTAGAVPKQRGRGEAATDDAWTLATTELEPSQARASVKFSNEDADRIPGLEQALRRDLRMAMTERIDRSVFVGDDNASEAGADITGLQTYSGITEQEITQANKVKGPESLAAFVAFVDGKHAAGLGDVRAVLSIGSHNLWAATLGNSAADSMTILAFLKANGLACMARGDIETATAEDDFGAFVGLQRGISGTGIVAVWNAARLIHDPYSLAREGQVRLTLSYSWAFEIARATNWGRVKFVA